MGTQDINNLFGFSEEEIQIEQSIDDIINQKNLNQMLNKIKVKTNVGDEIKEKYRNIKNLELLYDIQQFTKVIETVKKDRDNMIDIFDLEDFRMFKRGFLLERGIFYSEGPPTVSKYKELLGTSLLVYTSFNERYQIPIRLPNGDVFGFIGYDSNIPHSKYEFPRSSLVGDWYIAGNMVGNLESLQMYDGNEVYVTEGLFDAYRINEVFNKKSVAVLGVKSPYKKKKVLNLLRDKGHKLIGVPDYDETGEKSWLKELNYFDQIYPFNDIEPVIIRGEKMYFKDIDEKYKFLRGLDKNPLR